MADTVIHVPRKLLGWNRELSDGFSLGNLPGGGYGIVWRRGPQYLAQWTYGIPWESPHAPVRFEFESQWFVFCQEGASDEEIAAAPTVTYVESYDGR